MQLDPEQYIDFDLNHLTLGYQVWALESYINLLEEQIAFSQGQYKLRTERELQKQKPQLDENEYEDSISIIHQMADDGFPRFFRNGAIITIWSFFEYISFDFAKYAQTNEKNQKSSFRNILAKKGKDKGYNEVLIGYFEENLSIKLPWSEKDLEKLEELRLLRNHIVHRNGNVVYEAEEERYTRKRLSKDEDKSTMYALDSDIVNYSRLVVSMIRNLYHFLAKKYNHAILF